MAFGPKVSRNFIERYYCVCVCVYSFPILWQFAIRLNGESESTRTKHGTLYKPIYNDPIVTWKLQNLISLFNRSLFYQIQNFEGYFARIERKLNIEHPLPSRCSENVLTALRFIRYKISKATLLESNEN